MSYQGDILLVENDLSVLERLKNLFELKGYSVFGAYTLQQANDVLQDKHIDLAIIDVRLSDDNDTYDRSGIMLAEEMDPNIAKLLLSAFDNFVFGPTLPQNAWTFAKQRGPQEILTQVSRIFRDSIRVNRDLCIETDNPLSLSSLIRQIKVYRSCSPEEADQVAQEFEKLLRRLFLRETRIKLYDLSPERGGSGVVLVRPFYASQGTSGKGALIVVKFGLREELVQEIEDYKKNHHHFLKSITTGIIGNVAKTRHLAGAKFRFLGASKDKPLQEVDAFAVAQLKDVDEEAPLELEVEYNLLVGISSEPLNGFIVRKFALLNVDMIEIDVIVRASSFDIAPTWLQRLKFIQGHDSELVEFVLVPKKIGDKKIEVEFLYQRHRLNAIVLNVTVVASKSVEE